MLFSPMRICGSYNHATVIYEKQISYDNGYRWKTLFIFED